MSKPMDIEQFALEREEVLANVYPRLCSRKNVPDDLVSRSFLDMGEIYYLQLEGLDMRYNITKSFAERVGITDEEIDEAAKENMRKQRPVLTEMRSVIDELMGRKKSASNLLDESFFTSDTPTIRTAKQGNFPEMFVLTNKDRLLGAIHLMDQDLHKRLFKAFGEYYILPSSIHEVLIICKDPSLDPYDLRKMVQEVNQTQVADHEILSDNVYASYGMGIKPLFDDYKKELKPPKSRKR